MKPKAKAANILGLTAALGLLLWFLLSIPSHKDLLTPVAVAGVFGFAAFWLHAVDAAGALSGAVVSFLLYAIGGFPLFGCLFLVFILTWVATRAGHSTKHVRGIAEKPDGRSASQVMANLFVPCVAVVSGQMTAAEPYVYLWYPCAIAALAEAAADTVSSEVGEAFGGSPRLVTTLKKVSPGTNGGVTVLGTMAGIVTALFVAVGCGREFASVRMVPLIAGAATLGMFVDSLLGATLENRGILNNDAVNLLGTASAAFVLFLWLS
jgi:uncharacterized protein (TIGR00297 family)